MIVFTIGISVDRTDDQFSFNFYEEGSGQTSSPFEAVVADQVSWNEKYPNSLYATCLFQDDSKLSEDVDISDRPSQPTLELILMMATFIIMGLNHGYKR